MLRLLFGRTTPMTDRIRALPAAERVQAVGHRRYVGGHDPELWYGIGRLQYHYLVSQGLRPEHRFVDIACGSLRLGQFLIPYLDAENYYGLEGEEALVRQGAAAEIGFGLMEAKRPHFAFNYDFDFSFVDRFDCAMAQSLFTHMTPDDIRLCFKNLHRAATASSRFYFTFFEGDSKRNRPGPSHANRSWYYSFEELRTCAEPDWLLSYIGDWKHPKHQMMVLATPA
jgi:hypothetical protein